ncbi:MAG: hypothetical protein NTV86_13470 [Planctomycetota bacterium]|nr:hypothetical protein [Planctomycetota bacterium]
MNDSAQNRSGLRKASWLLLLARVAVFLFGKARPYALVVARAFVFMCRAALYPILAIGVGVVVYPMFWLLCTSLRTSQDFYAHPLWLPAWGDLQCS